MHPVKAAKRSSVEIKRAFNPIMFLFLLTGLEHKKSNKKRSLFFSALFHVIFLKIFIIRVYCVISEFIAGRLLILIEKVISLVVWWFIKVKMRKINALVKYLEVLKDRADLEDIQILSRICKRTVVAVIFIMCLVPTIRSLHFLISSKEIHLCLGDITYTFGMFGKFGYFLYEIGQIFISIVPPYAGCIFYTLYCCMLTLLSPNKHFSAPEARRINQMRFEILEKFESAFSVIIFVIFSLILCNFFKIIFLFAYSLKSDMIPFVYTCVIDFITNSILVIVMVLSADNVQKSVNHSRGLFPVALITMKEFGGENLVVSQKKKENLRSSLDGECLLFGSL
ncbi:uncharacterized protein CEXT_669241 [Caerostris extrusa]|uniref:Gustatory receptor n=1 Tax=Caerostris extrusa TaxID=172846 RepID=A0AAV4U886_CAEEX|nr:uncharacterized protein CEXT_669241 [Caerostris extrusa]